MNNFFKLCFFLFSAVCGMENNQERVWYRKFLDNRKVGIPTSAIAGGGIAAGLTYLFRKNTFLSSFRAAEKVKYAPYFKFVGTGAIVTVGLYELLKRLTKPKESDKGKDGINASSPQLKENHEKNAEGEPKEDYNKIIKVIYVCPGNLYSLLKFEPGLKTETATKIEDIVSKGEIKQYRKNQFWFCSSDKRYNSLMPAYLRGVKYAAALYLMNGDQKESFKKKFKESSPEEKSSLYNLCEIKPTSQDNLWCYVLPLESSVDHEDNKTYSPNISPEITEQTIDSYSFQLTQDDATKINLGAEDIIGVEFMPRTNTQNAMDKSNGSDYF